MDKREMIDWLKLEIEVIEKGGYSPSVREPRKQPQIFRDSVVCPNMGLEEKIEPCSHCFLMEFVPAEHRDRADNPCHFIPLNDNGDTVASLAAAGDDEKAQTLLLSWLYKTIARLEKELTAGPPARV